MAISSLEPSTATQQCLDNWDFFWSSQGSAELPKTQAGPTPASPARRSTSKSWLWQLGGHDRWFLDRYHPTLGSWRLCRWESTCLWSETCRRRSLSDIFRKPQWEGSIRWWSLLGGRRLPQLHAARLRPLRLACWFLWILGGKIWFRASSLQSSTLPHLGYRYTDLSRHKDRLH